MPPTLYDKILMACIYRAYELALDKPESVEFKVRAWLYQRACLLSFGTSGENSSGCIDLKEKNMENPYDCTRDGRSMLSCRMDNLDDYEAKLGEWDKAWSILKGHLVIQGVQRVNLDREAGVERRC